MVKLILKNESDIIFLPRNKGKLKWKDFHQCVTPIVYEIKKKNQVLKGWENRCKNSPTSTFCFNGHIVDFKQRNFFIHKNSPMSRKLIAAGL